jgi:hypothetical protein
MYFISVSNVSIKMHIFTGDFIIMVEDSRDICIWFLLISQCYVWRAFTVQKITAATVSLTSVLTCVKQLYCTGRGHNLPHNGLDHYLSYIYLGYFVCVSVRHNCRTLCYSFSFIYQTDQGNETEGLEREG